jgi:membrane protease subunit (stomatin/prohibitin family)
MIGGAGYMAGKSGQRAAYREDDEQQRLSQLEAQQAAAQPAPNQSGDLVSKIKELSQLRDAGALTEPEFEAAKAKLLAS